MYLVKKKDSWNALPSGRTVRGDSDLEFRASESSLGCVVMLPPSDVANINRDGFAAKVVGVIDSVISTGSGSDRIRAHPQRKMRSLSFKETSGSRRYRSGY